MKEINAMCLMLFYYTKGRIRMATVEELVPKPVIFKKAGMIGPPFETVKEDDNGTMGTLIRLVKEELPFSLQDINIHEVVS